jgi:hypothetical protein
MTRPLLPRFALDSTSPSGSALLIFQEVKGPESQHLKRAFRRTKTYELATSKGDTGVPARGVTMVIKSSSSLPSTHGYSTA